jgi:hypothetical protein
MFAIRCGSWRAISPRDPTSTMSRSSAAPWRSGPERNRQTVRLIARYGFDRVAAAARVTMRERAHQFGEIILISLMVLARNAAALRGDALRRGRIHVFLSRRVLEQRGPRRTRSAARGRATAGLARRSGSAHLEQDREGGERGRTKRSTTLAGLRAFIDDPDAPSCWLKPSRTDWCSPVSVSL